jgi:hypothetical protein
MISGMTTETKREWPCGTCGLRVRNTKIQYLPMPSTWDRDDEGKPRCGVCRRKANGEPTEGFSSGRANGSGTAAKIRDILLGLHPAYGSEAVEKAAEAVGCGTGRVNEIRGQMRRAGELPGGPAPTEADATVAALERLGTATVEELAEALGVRRQAVASRLKRLGGRVERAGTASGKGKPAIYRAVPGVPAPA